MNDDVKAVLEIQKKRFEFLKLLYDEIAKSRKVKAISLEVIAEKIGISKDEAVPIFKYLSHKGLIKNSSAAPGVTILPNGISEIETALTRPEKPTDYFPSNIVNVIYNTGTMTGVQQGNVASSQTVNIVESQREMIFAVIKELKDIIQKETSLDGDKKEELAHEINLAEIEINTKKPKWERVKGYLTSIKNLTEGTAIAISAGSKIDGIIHLMGT